MTTLLNITPGAIKVGEVTVEITGHALDALTLAEQFVQVFDVSQSSQLYGEAMDAFRAGYHGHYLAISQAISVWHGVERVYAEALRSAKAVR